MKKFLALALIVAMTALVPMQASAAVTGQIAGTVRGLNAQTCTVRVLDIASGAISSRSTINSTGQFMLTGLAAGRYAVEVLDNSGRVLASSAVALTPKAMNATVDLSAAQAKTPPPAAAAGGSFFTSAAGIVTLVAIGAGVTTAVVIATKSASK